jgi:hypothetical protein
MITGRNHVRKWCVTTLLCLALLSCNDSALRKELVFPAEELQQKIAKQFPIERKDQFAKLQLANPQVLLQQGDERIGMRMDLVIEPPFIKKQCAGEVEFDAEVEYKPARGEFFLVDARVRHFNLIDVPKKYQTLAQGLVNQVLKRYLDELPVYTLDGDNFKESLAKLVLKKVQVKDGKLVLEVGLL